MQKWQNTSAGPIQCKRFNTAWNKLNWENNTFVELTGVIGENERRCVLATMGGTRNRADVTAAKESIGERFNWTVTAANVNEITAAIAAALETLQQNRPIEDRRTSPDAEAARRAELARMQAEQKAKGDAAAAAFVRHYGNGEKVTAQPGQMIITARICFDDSDSMSDYFNRHATLSQPFALLIVPKQAETERLARRGVTVSPLLSGIELEWHTEKWSMGHGNYLEAKGGFELPSELQGLRNRGGYGGDLTHAHWEVTFQHVYREPVTLDAIAGYGQAGPESDKTSKIDGVTVTENDEKNGIEIRFPSKPSAEVLDSLKANGWRWSRFSGCWYAMRTDRARKFAESLTGNTTETKPTGQPAPDPAAPLAAGAAIATRFRTWADAMQPKIDHAGRPMTQNPTPKRNREYQSRMHDCRNMERTQKALRALADAHERGAVPAELAGLKTRDEIAKLVRKYVDGSKGGYYSCIESDDYAEKTQAARALQSLIEGNPAEKAETERLRKIEALKAEIALSTIPGYFPTQAPVTAYMLDLAQIKPGMSFCEPQAGSGHIADAIRGRIADAKIDVCEINPRLQQLLRLKGYDLAASDFLEWETTQKYDRIIMNPPFEKQADIDHVRKAHGLLDENGLLVSVMAPGFQFRQDRKSAEFRTWLDQMGAHIEDLPSESFKASGTSVSTKLVVIPAGSPSTLQPQQTETEFASV